MPKGIGYFRKKSKMSRDKKFHGHMSAPTMKKVIVSSAHKQEHPMR